MPNELNAAMETLEKAVARLFETVDAAAHEVCEIIKRPDFHQVIVRANWDLFQNAPDVDHDEERVTLQYDKYCRSVDEVCTAASRHDLLEVILDATWALMKASFAVARMRKESPDFDRHMQAWIDRCAGFPVQQGQNTMH